MSRGTAVGEIQKTTPEMAQVLFLGVPCHEPSAIARAVLEGAGVAVRREEFFTAEVDLDGTTAHELAPSDFAPLPRDSEVEIVWE